MEIILPERLARLGGNGLLLAKEMRIRKVLWDNLVTAGLELEQLKQIALKIATRMTYQKMPHKYAYLFIIHKNN